ncbi:MAG TPA: hypothetical protein VJM11_15810, partial [Nevskiaceae bacterium]|nr:hypothetical protein [Nevskiaceae bacterium]
MIKSGLVAAALVFSAAGFACDGNEAQRVAKGGMDDFRAQAMAQLRAENLQALQDSLRRTQSELASETRERF